MGQEYKQSKGKQGWYTVGTDRWKCDCCGSLLRTKSSYDYFNGICFHCRLQVPNYIPEEQIRKWLNQNLEKSKNVNLVE
jgi:hypothetical protein